MSEVRLQKFLAECGVGSRRKMEQFIKEGRVRINGQVVTELGRKIDPATDRVEVNRRPVHAAPKGIMLLNKPRGVVSTLSDPEGRRSVADFLTKHYSSYFPVGRLDWDSTGLMVLTNDGEVAERLMHPRYGFERVYHARVEGAVPVEVLSKLERGIRLSDGFVKAQGTILKNDDSSTWVEVRIHEGRNRVVRRLFEKLGHPVMKLKRIVYGPFKLGRLQVGQVRVLTHKEYEEVRIKVLRAKETAEVEVAAPSKVESRVAPKTGVSRAEQPHRRGDRSGRERGERSGTDRGRAGSGRTGSGRTGASQRGPARDGAKRGKPGRSRSRRIR
jgi:23S rRNA pseudouridine2605 synthase